MRRADVLIAGAGPAGAAAAIGLARRGLRPLLLERAREPRDIVCGGFLGPDALALLAGLGLDPQALGARPIDRLRLAAGGRQTDFALPFRAAGLSRLTLDAALRDAALAAGAGLERGITVRALTADSARLADGARIEARATLLATGKHDLRGLARHAVADEEAMVGLRLDLAPTPALTRALEGRIELMLVRRGHAGLLLLEDGRANLCLSIAAARLAEAGSVERLLDRLGEETPLLGLRLGQAARGPAQAVAGMPYGWVAKPVADTPWRLGDQAATIPSLAGDGVAIALASGVSAAAHLAAGGDGQTYQQAFARQAGRPVAIAAHLRQLAEKPHFALPMLRIAARFPAVVRWLAIHTRIEGY